MTSGLVRVMVAASVLGVAGCGGGGGRGPSPVTVTLVATPQLTGPVDSSGIIQNNVGSTNLRAGDSSAPSTIRVRGFVSFDRAAIPAGARVLDATLTLTQEAVGGTPYVNLGSVVVDQVVYGNVLDAGAFDRSFPSNQAFATLSTSETLGSRSVSAILPVQLAIDSGHAQVQFRVRFTIDTDGGPFFDEVEFTGPQSPAVAGEPRLVVTYQP